MTYQGEDMIGTESCDDLAAEAEGKAIARQYRDDLLMILVKVEWGASSVPIPRERAECPECRMRQFRGHAPDCNLDAMLKPMLAAYRAERGIK